MVNQFGKKIKELRRINYLKQKDVAYRLGIDTPMLCKIEKGERKARKELVIVFSKMFKIDYNDLLSIWLSDQVLEIIQGEEKNAVKAMALAEQVIMYNIDSNNNLNKDGKKI